MNNLIPYIIHNVNIEKNIHNSFKIMISPYGNSLFSIELSQCKLIIYNYPELEIVYKYESLSSIDATYLSDGNLLIYGASIVIQKDQLFNVLIKNADVILLSISNKYICYYDDSNYINIILVSTGKQVFQTNVEDISNIAISDNYMAYSLKNYVMIYKNNGTKWTNYKKISNANLPSLLFTYSDTLLLAYSGCLSVISLEDSKKLYSLSIEDSGKYNMCVSYRGQLILSSPYAYRKSGIVSIYMYIDGKWRLKKNINDYNHYLCGSNKNELYGKYISVSNTGTIFTVSNNNGEGIIYSIE